MKDMFNTLFGNKIKSKKELLKLFYDLADQGIIEAENLSIIESVLQIGDLKARDIMLPRHQIDFIDIKDEMPVLVDKIIKTKHSRFPVIDGEISNIIGVFHNKDLVPYIFNIENFNLREHLYQAYFVPELKPLDALMYEMRVRQSHLAIIVDEFTNVVGMITLEMIIEEIIGDIEDEHDLIDDERDIIEIGNNVYRLKGQATLHDINDLFNLELDDEYVETISGYLTKSLGRVPSIGEVFEFKNLTIEIVNADRRKVKLLTLTQK